MVQAPNEINMMDKFKSEIFLAHVIHIFINTIVEYPFSFIVSVVFLAKYIGAYIFTGFKPLRKITNLKKGCTRCPRSLYGHSIYNMYFSLSLMSWHVNCLFAGGVLFYFCRSYLSLCHSCSLAFFVE